MSTIKGTKGNDYIIGSELPETIKGGKGNDVLDGRGGADILKGGKGADTFLFRADQTGVPTVLDFKPGKDRIIVDVGDNQVPGYGDGLLTVYDLENSIEGAFFPTVVSAVTPLAYIVNQTPLIGNDDLISI